MKLNLNNTPKLIILAFSIFFLYVSGVVENSIGKYPDCIGVCNKPGHLSIAWVILWCVFIAILIIFSKPLIKKCSYIEDHSFFYLLFVLCFCIFSLYVTNWGMDSDDRWLEYRISKNVLEYGLYYWNPHELINISTPVVWPYIASQAHILSRLTGMAWEHSIKILGLFIYVGTAIYIYRMKFSNKSIRNYVFIGVVSYFPFAYWSISGLEAVLACFWVIFIVNKFYSKGFTNINWLVYCSIIFIRPELIIAPFFSMIVYSFINYRQRNFYNLLIPFLLLFSVSAFWLIFNWLVWKDFFPTPFYLKSIFHSPFLAELTWSFKVTNALIHFLSSVAQSFFLAIGLLVLFFCSAQYFFNKSLRSSFRQEQQVALVLFVGFLAVAAYHIVSGYHHMSYIFRYFLPENIALIAISGIAIQEEIARRNFSDGKIIGGFISLMTVIQLSIFIASGYYVNNIELSLTRAKHRDAFTGESYASMMAEWRRVGKKLKSIELPNDRLWIRNGTNLAGGAITNMYALDGYYSPLWRSKFKSIRECKEWDCAKYFNYIMATDGDESWRKLILSDRYEVLMEVPGVVLLKNKSPEY